MWIRKTPPTGCPASDHALADSKKRVGVGLAKLKETPTLSEAGPATDRSQPSDLDPTLRGLRQTTATALVRGSDVPFFTHTGCLHCSAGNLIKGITPRLRIHHCAVEIVTVKGNGLVAQTLSEPLQILVLTSDDVTYTTIVSLRQLTPPALGSGGAIQVYALDHIPHGCAPLG